MLMLSVAVVAALLSTGAARPGMPPSGPQAADTVRAATERAVMDLYAQVSGLPLEGGLTVGELLERLGAREQFMRGMLEVANQIGGPRWIDQHTCQVHLEISASRIASDLKRLVAAAPRGPVTTAQIDRSAERWLRRTFAAIGSSALPTSLTELKPADAAPWNTIADEDRRKALEAARQQAIQGVLAGIEDIPLGTRTMGDALRIAEVRQPVEQWLAARPILMVRFTDELEVEVHLAVARSDFFQQLKAVLEKQDQIVVAVTWEQLERDINRRLGRAVGRSVVAGAAAQVVSRIEVPSRAPDWVTAHLDVSGTSQDVGGKLLTRAAAERDALAKLEARLEALPLLPGMSVGEASRRDPRIAQAVARVLRRAHTFKTEYRSDGGVVVQMTLPARDLWEELQR